MSQQLHVLSVTSGLVHVILMIFQLVRMVFSYSWKQLLAAGSAAEVEQTEIIMQSAYTSVIAQYCDECMGITGTFSPNP